MIRKVEMADIGVLSKIAKQTFRETFAHDNTEEQLQEYFEEAYSLRVLSTELENPESETYFVLNEEQEICGFLKINWGQAQTEPVEMDKSFEIQRIYVKKEFHGAGFGKEMFTFALDQAKSRGFEWAWLGVWERNFKAQDFYYRFGFERFSEHEYPTGDTVDIDWLLRKKLI